MITFLVLTVAGLAVAGMVTHRHNAAEVRRGLERARALGVGPGARGAGRPHGSGGRIPILMPVCGRPHYLRQVLDALSRVRGIEKAILVVSQDGRDAEVSALVAGIRFADVIVLRHRRPFLGVFVFFWDGLHAVSTHIRHLLDFAFEGLGATHAIVLEDDIVPSPDFLRYFEWACRHLLRDDRTLSVTGFNIHSRTSPDHGFDPREHPHEMVENREGGRPKFTGWSWAIGAAMWRRIRREWSDLSWDTRLDEVQTRLGLVSYKPVLARVKNIGMQGGINFTEPEESPKWTALVLAEGPLEDAPPPRLLPDDPARPAWEETPSAGPIRNQRQRTRARRLWLAAILAAMTLAEILAWRAFGP